MSSYEPNPELTKAVLTGILAPLPFVTGMVAKRLPYKEAAVGRALQHVVPTSLRAIASTQAAGARLALTRHGELTEETKQSLLRRIAVWFVPDEVQDVSKALQQDIIRLGREGFGEEAWRLEATEGEIVLVVLDTSILKASADTVADMFMDSFERLKGFKNKLPLFSRKASASERDVVCDVLAALEGTRALGAGAAREEPAQLVASIEDAEHLLSGALARLGDKSPARDCFAVMRTACHELMTPPITEEFPVSLGKLRQTFGWQIAVLGSLYDVAIEGDLASLLPPEAN